MSELPTKEELKELPLTHIVAYAYRCAARVFPLFKRWGAGSKYVSFVEEALVVASKFAQETTYLKDTASIASIAARDAANAAYADNAARAARAARAAIAAREAAYAAANAAIAARAAANAARAAANAANASAANASAARIDFGKLVNLPDQPFDPGPEGPLGPLWPDGEPDWDNLYIAETPESLEGGEEESHGLVKLKMLLPANMTEDEIVQYCTKLAEQLDGAYKAIGGDGLTIDDVRRWDPVCVPTGVPQ